MKRLFMLCVLLPLFSLSSSSHYSGQKQKSAEEMIRDFAASYQEKAAIEEKAVFSIEIKGEGGGEWSVQIGPERKVIILQGKPEEPTFYFTTDLETLRKIYKSELSAMTAAGRARASESAPLDIKFMEGTQPSPETMARILHYTFHFFVMGSPEIVFFGEEHSRLVHGGNMVVFYYAKGLRTAWCQVKKGMVINKEERDQTNPFPTLFICTRGEGIAKLGGKVMNVKKGMMAYIPAGISHTVWNEKDEPLEGILIMFGEGA